MSKREELLAQGYTVVVSDDRVLHMVSGDCWAEGDRLIPLPTVSEAVAHGYAYCDVCVHDVVEVRVEHDGAGAADDEAEA